MDIRKLASDDWEKLRDIRIKGFKNDLQAFGGDMSEELSRKEPQWRKRLEDPERFFFAAEQDGALISLAGAKKVSENIWWLIAVVTNPEHRGKGISQKVINAVLDEAKTRGIGTMQLMVNVDQKDAVHIYEKFGFRAIEIKKGELMADGKLHDLYLMEMGF